ncbi:3-keto-5-aminohexanoate cleavage protein [Caenispirillum salinarum]|uniref:3-keto-5-aminohexanoate cleavage protein n=1 Tax=Caenispirillum salinarum TaxID=859058 RepID=UPI00384D835E
MSGVAFDQPMAVCVAPNGARKTRDDHPAVPVTAREVAEGAVRWREAGAAMLHLHVRDAQAGHVLDADLYIEATAAVRAAVGDDMVIQITTEAVGKYTAAEQMAVVRAVRPEAVSLAVRELIPDADHEKDAAAFLSEVVGWGCAPQYILYAAEDVARLHDLRRRGIIPGNRMNVLFVLGRYSRNQDSDPRDLLPFLERWNPAVDGPFSVCAFGRREGTCVLAAGALGGHARVGFENNTLRADGSAAADNADLVAQVAEGARLLGRRVASADDIRRLMDPL